MNPNPLSPRPASSGQYLPPQDQVGAAVRLMKLKTEVAMVKDPVMVLAGKWFEKFNDPSTAMYNIAHARRPNSAPKFKPQEIVDQLRKTSDLRMRKLADAVEELGTPEKKKASGK